ncbi:MAG: OmpH family outer membrane protein [Shimia sp.]
MRALLAALAMTWALSAPAQEVPQSQVLTLDVSALFAQSAYGRQVQRNWDAAALDLARENRTIEQELRTEELALTEQRPTLSREEFADLAAAFDERVEALRSQQDAAREALTSQLETAEREFIRAIRPILAQMMQEAGASVILDSSTVFLRENGIDVTRAAIARIDAALPEPGPLEP